MYVSLTNIVEVKIKAFKKINSYQIKLSISLDKNNVEDVPIKL